MTSLLQFARYRVEDSARDLLRKEISARVSETSLDSDLDDAILGGIGVYALRRHLPGDILQGSQVFTAAGSHALLLSNLPTQDFPATPVSGFADESELAVTNAIHLGMIRLLGCTPFAVSYENDGRLIRNVVPNPAASGTTSSWGADSEFFWHSDNPHQPFGPPGSDPGSTHRRTSPSSPSATRSASPRRSRPSTTSSYGSTRRRNPCSGHRSSRSARPTPTTATPSARW